MEIVHRHFIIVLLLFLFERCKYKNNFLQSITISHFFAIKYKNTFIKAEIRQNSGEKEGKTGGFTTDYTDSHRFS